MGDRYSYSDLGYDTSLVSEEESVLDVSDDDGYDDDDESEYFGISPEEHEEQLRKQKKELGLPHKLRMDINDNEIVRLKDEENLTLRKIAMLLHCSPNTVRNRYNKAKGIK